MVLGMLQRSTVPGRYCRKSWMQAIGGQALHRSGLRGLVALGMLQGSKGIVVRRPSSSSSHVGGADSARQGRAAREPCGS